MALVELGLFVSHSEYDDFELWYSREIPWAKTLSQALSMIRLGSQLNEFQKEIMRLSTEPGTRRERGSMKRFLVRRGLGLKAYVFCWKKTVAYVVTLFPAHGFNMAWSLCFKLWLLFTHSSSTFSSQILEELLRQAQQQQQQQPKTMCEPREADVFDKRVVADLWQVLDSELVMVSCPSQTRFCCWKDLC